MSLFVDLNSLRKVDPGVEDERRAGKKNFSFHQNNQVLLEIIRQNPRISRKELSRITGVSQSLITKICTDLLDKGLIREVDTGHSSGGRRPIYIEMDHNAFYLSSLLISQNEVSVAVCDYRSNIKTYVRNYMSADEFLSCDILHEIEQIMTQFGYLCQGIGIAAEDEIFYSDEFVRITNQIAHTDIPFLSIRSSHAALVGMNKVVYHDQYPNSAYIHVGRRVFGAIMNNGRALIHNDPQIGSQWNKLSAIGEMMDKIQLGMLEHDEVVRFILHLCDAVYCLYGVDMIFLDIAKGLNSPSLERALVKHLSRITNYNIGIIPFGTVFQRGVVIELANQMNHGI